MDRSGFSDFDRLVELVSRTYALLDRVADDGRLGPDAADFLADATLPHLESARAAFRSWLRAEMAGAPELQYLVRQDGAAPPDPVTEAERRAARLEAALEVLRRGRRNPVPISADERRAFTALSHARLVLGLLPHVPDEDVRFPSGRRTYADIPVPRGPAELALRIEELERQVWRMAVGREAEPRDPAFRRTYGFFDVADQLGRRGFRPH